jgi:hypothetical protein
MKRIVLGDDSVQMEEHVEARSHGRPWQGAHELRFPRCASATESTLVLQAM